MGASMRLIARIIKEQDEEEQFKRRPNIDWDAINRDYSERQSVRQSNRLNQLPVQGLSSIGTSLQASSDSANVVDGNSENWLGCRPKELKSKHKMQDSSPMENRFQNTSASFKADDRNNENLVGCRRKEVISKENNDTFLSSQDTRAA